MFRYLGPKCAEVHEVRGGKKRKGLNVDEQGVCLQIFDADSERKTSF